MMGNCCLAEGVHYNRKSTAGEPTTFFPEFRAMPDVWDGELPGVSRVLFNASYAQHTYSFRTSSFSNPYVRGTDAYYAAGYSQV